ncbi:substrate carrier protein, partial [Tanacetum coccineum]
GQLFAQVVRKEGARSLYLGLTPTLTRSLLYGGLRLGLYEPSKKFCELAVESTNIFMKIASGAVSGAFVTLPTNPMEAIKVKISCSTFEVNGLEFVIRSDEYACLQWGREDE